MREDACGCGGPHLDIPVHGGMTPSVGVRGEKQKAVVSSTARVCKGEFVQRVLEYVPVGDKLRWGLEDIHILDAVELSNERVGVVFAQGKQTKFKLLALEDGELALGNTIVLVEDEALETAALVEIDHGRALVAYNREADGTAAVITLDGRTAALAYTDVWGEGDPENICACRLGNDKVLVSYMQLTYSPNGKQGEAFVQVMLAGKTRLDLRAMVRVDGNNDTDAYIKGWSLVEVTDTTAVLIFPQGLDKPVGFAVIDVNSNGVPDVRCIGNGKYAASLPTIQAVPLDDRRWGMAYGVCWLTPDKKVTKSALAIEVWGLTRYAADLIWYGCEDVRYASGIGGVSAASNSMGAAITYTGEKVARVIHLGVWGTPYAGPGVVLGSHGGFCRVVPITLTRALLVSQEGGNGYVGLMEVAERIVPSHTMVSGVALVGGDPGEEITVKTPKQ